jgi:uncharacterized membrane-anchored protein
MASTFLVRLRLGPDLVDAKGVSRLYRTGVRTRELWLLLAAALLCFVVITAVMPPTRLFWRLFWSGTWDQIRQLVPGL